MQAEPTNISPEPATGALVTGVSTLCFATGHSASQLIKNAPPATIAYGITDGQVRVPAAALLRKGIQPVVTLRVQGGQRAEVRVGKPVTFTAVVEVPPGAGKVVNAAWDFEGQGTFLKAGHLLPANKAGTQVRVETTYTFTKPVTYFPTLRAASQRQGDAKDVYTRIQNLDRVRVVVKYPI